MYQSVFDKPHNHKYSLKQWNLYNGFNSKLLKLYYEKRSLNTVVKLNLDEWARTVLNPKSTWWSRMARRDNDIDKTRTSFHSKSWHIVTILKIIIIFYFGNPRPYLALVGPVKWPVLDVV